MKWIRVEDKLPKDRQNVLAFNGKIHICIFNENPGTGIDSLWESHTREKEEDWGLYNVNYWIPLPNPPGYDE